MRAKEPHYQHERARIHDGATVKSRASGAFPRTVEVLVDYPGKDFSVSARLTKQPFCKAKVEATATEWVDGNETRAGRLEETGIRLGKMDSLQIIVNSSLMDAITVPLRPEGSKMNADGVKLAILNAILELKQEY